MRLPILLLLITAAGATLGQTENPYISGREYPLLRLDDSILGSKFAEKPSIVCRPYLILHWDEYNRQDKRPGSVYVAFQDENGNKVSMTMSQSHLKIARDIGEPDVPTIVWDEIIPKKPRTATIFVSKKDFSDLAPCITTE